MSKRCVWRPCMNRKDKAKMHPDIYNTGCKSKKDSHKAPLGITQTTPANDLN